MHFLRLLAAGTLFLGGNLNLFPELPAAPVASQRTPEVAAPVRILAVPRDENGYGGFGSLVIDSRAQFDSFQKTVAGQAGWNDRAKFLQVLDQARLDFQRESLVLIRQGDSSSSQSVHLAAPRMRGDTVTCTVRVSGSPRNRDVVYRCFAVVVDKRKVRRVEVEVREGAEGKLQEPLVVGKQ
jgi:hypothetical protein